MVSLPPSEGRISAAREDELPPSEGRIRPESRAQLVGRYTDIVLRALMVLVICLIFMGLNVEVMRFIWAVFEADQVALKTSPSTTRVVTTQVLMSLIAGTAVQVGVAIIAIVSYLFPKNLPRS